MNREALMAKVASSQIQVNPQIRDLMQRVRETGLHKIASQMYSTPDFNIKVAAQLLGSRLIVKQRKYEKIASGLQAMKVLEQLGLNKNAGMYPMPTQMNPNPSLLSKLRKVVSATDVPATAPNQFGGALNQGSAGMFDSFKQAPQANFNPKLSIRGQSRPELPAMNYMPQAPTT